MRNRTVRMVLSLVLAVVVGLLLAGGLLQIMYLAKDIELTVHSTEAAREPGETVTLAVSMGSNPGITDFEFGLDYDRTRLELLHVNNSYRDENGQTVPYLPEEYTTIEIREDGENDFGYVSASFPESMTSENIVLCSVTFRILDESSIGVADVGVIDCSFSNLRENGKRREIDVVTTEGGILVGEPKCRHMDEAMDTYCDICGKQIADIQYFDLFGMNVTLDNSLTMNFYAPRGPINETTRELAVHIARYTGPEEVETYEMPVKDLERRGDYYVIPVELDMDQLSDQIEVSLRDVRGYAYNNPCVISVRDYVAKLMEHTSDPKLKTLLVDMLNYGTAVQQQTQYRVDTLANELLTEEQQAMATDAVVCTDSRVIGKNYVGSALSADKGAILHFVFDGVTEAMAHTLKAEISFTNAQGEEKVYELTKTPVLKKYESYGYRLTVDQITFADASQPVTVRIKNSDGSIYAEATDSVESYICRKGGNEAMAELYGNLMKFSASACAYSTK